jgi:hypothetical protein
VFLNKNDFFIVFYLGQLDQHDNKVVNITILFGQFLLFLLLMMIGTIYGFSYIQSYQLQYRSYSFTNARLITFKATLINGCSNLTDLPCSLQEYINDYFFWIKFSFIYFSLIIIAMIYTWHRTVRLTFCAFALCTIKIIVFGTNFILIFDKIFCVTVTLCVGLISTFFSVTAYMPPKFEDPLRVHCGPDVLSIDCYEFLQTDTSKRARFYRWVHKIKKQWNIDEEKLIITTIAGVVNGIFCIIFASYFAPLVCLGKQ